MCLCQQAKQYVNKLKPETTAEARSYFRAFWDKQDKCCCDYKAEGVCRMTGRHVICEHKKWWQIWK